MFYRSRFPLLEPAKGADEGDGGGAPPSTVSSEEFNKLKEQFEGLSKLNSELKNQNESLSGKIKEFETQKLEESGDNDAIIKRLKEEIDTYKSTNSGLKDKFRLTLAKTSLKSALQSKGCEHVDDAINLYSKDLKGIEVNKDNFEISPKSVESLVERISNEKPFLFKQEAPNIDDINQTKAKQEDYVDAIRKCKTQKEFDEVRKKFGRI